MFIAAFNHGFLRSCVAHPLSWIQATQRELVLLVLRGIPEEMKMFDSGLPDRRKRDLQNALNTTVDSLFKLFHQLLQEQYDCTLVMLDSKLACSYIQYVQAGLPPEHTAQHQRLILALLNCIAAYVGWVPARYE